MHPASEANTIAEAASWGVDPAQPSGAEGNSETDFSACFQSLLEQEEAQKLLIQQANALLQQTPQQSELRGECFTPANSYASGSEPTYRITRKCKSKGCTKVSQGRTPFCKAHGGGRRCKQEGCLKCTQGSTPYCVAHGGGRRCQWEPQCHKSAQGRTLYCVAHGGGRRCQVEKCTKSAVGRTNKCITHAGGSRSYAAATGCAVPDCKRAASGNGSLCRSHREASASGRPSGVRLPALGEALSFMNKGSSEVPTSMDASGSMIEEGMDSSQLNLSKLIASNGGSVESALPKLLDAAARRARLQGQVEGLSGNMSFLQKLGLLPSTDVGLPQFGGVDFLFGQAAQEKKILNELQLLLHQSAKSDALEHQTVQNQLKQLTTLSQLGKLGLIRPVGKLGTLGQLGKGIELLHAIEQQKEAEQMYISQAEQPQDAGNALPDLSQHSLPTLSGLSQSFEEKSPEETHQLSALMNFPENSLPALLPTPSNVLDSIAGNLTGIPGGNLEGLLADIGVGGLTGVTGQDMANCLGEIGLGSATQPIKNERNLFRMLHDPLASEPSWLA